AVLARLFSKSANLLVLDEPTNDLDIETLELLEEILLTFEGTVLLVSHDRDFMDNVITSLLVLDGSGGVREYVGGYSDWEARGGSLSDARAKSSTEMAKPASRDGNTSQKKPVSQKPKLSYKDQRELGNLPAKIEKLEQQQSQLEEQVSVPGFYQSEQGEVRRVTLQLAEVQAKLEVAFDRWGELERLDLSQG
ncbi:MAG: ABC transporter ATP-binding protein, partial [Gammaproteobacteria bacterium]|nr:ABC transporter ATP-binding protein [Gammaproteobacteria bacterium]